MSANFEENAHFFEVRLDLFDGPLDLLLHLVKQRELPIEKISLAQVASQYFACLEFAREYDLEIAGEYLVIAATLLSIKSSILLGEGVHLEVDADGNLFDPHEELLRRLREAEIYKEGAYNLSVRDLLDVDVFAGGHAVELGDSKAPLKDHNAWLLGKAFQKILVAANKPKALEIRVDPVSIVERMTEVLKILQVSSVPVSFVSLIPDRFDRGSVISVFLALLELCKRQLILVSQENEFGEVMIAQNSEVDYPSGLLELQSEFDVNREIKAAVGN